jgi:hypothetical protein
MAEATGTILPDPDFSCNEADPVNCRFIASVRPYRETTFRLEAPNQSFTITVTAAPGSR